MSAATNKTCVVIGASHAGVNFASYLRREGWEGDIVLFDSDPMMPYHRPPLSKTYLADGNLEGNLLKPAESYENDRIKLNLGQTVHTINKEQKHLVLSEGRLQPYDKLVIATGARPFIPKIDGIDKVSNVFAMRTGNDAINIKNALNTSQHKRVVIIGGGYIGLETAASLKKLGAQVTVLERETRVLSRVTAPIMSNYFMDLHKEKGVDILTSKNVISFTNNTNYITVACDDDTSYKADLIVIGVGIKINSELAESAGLEVENGIKVNASARTNHADIYAIGDCTYHFNPHYNRYLRLESVQNALDQAKVAAASICGKEVVYNTIPWFWSDQYDVKLQMVGLSNGYNEVLVRKEEDASSFSVWYFKDDTLLAVDAVNNGKAYVLGTKFIKENQLIDKIKLVDVSIVMKPTSFVK